MLAPIVAFSWMEFAEGFATALMAVSAWRHVTRDPIADLTEMVQHPWRWTLNHPIRAIGRKLER